MVTLLVIFWIIISTLIILVIDFINQSYEITKEDAKSVIQPNHYISKWERFKMKASVEGVKKEKQ